MNKCLSKYSIGIGDRFEQESRAQLQACIQTLERGVEITPVWNKSNREHAIVGSDPAGTRAAADEAVRVLGWRGPYFVDADHIRLNTVGRFLASSDFYTIDVADAIGQRAPDERIERFVLAHPELSEDVDVPGLASPLRSSPEALRGIAEKYLCAVDQAACVYRHIASKMSAGFIAEVSLDETDVPQTPLELLALLVALADEGVRAHTVAPRFVGAFHKGVDYIGDVEAFERQFQQHVAVVAFAATKYPLPPDLKLSLHSGSDKFSIYKPIRRTLRAFNAGLHVKTAGTTWLEEFVAIAEAGGAAGERLCRGIATAALARIDELCAPYQSVIGIERQKLPTSEQVSRWTGQELAAAVRHVPGNQCFNKELRQLIHVGYKVAAELRPEFMGLLNSCRPIVSRNVTENLFERHIRPLFLD